MTGLVCWNCGASLADIPRPISRHATCSECFNELHCCRLCKHFDPEQTMRCFEDRADPPLNKENANFCDFFSPQRGAFRSLSASKSTAAKQTLESLFNTEQTAPGASADHNDSGLLRQTASQSGASERAEEAEKPAETAPPLSKEELAKKKLDDLFGS